MRELFLVLGVGICLIPSYTSPTPFPFFYYGGLTSVSILLSFVCTLLLFDYSYLLFHSTGNALLISDTISGIVLLVADACFLCTISTPLLLFFAFVC